jgi:hypothetical protein
MVSKGQMRSIDGQFVQKDDIVIRDGTIVRILVAEWPYAVVRAYENGQFGAREITRLEGTYYVPSASFLREIGVYDSKLLRSEEDPDAVVVLKELLRESGQRVTEGSGGSPDSPGKDGRKPSAPGVLVVDPS